MEIYSRIKDQVDGLGLPLYAVTVTAVPRADTPVLVFLHWHGFRRETPLAMAGLPMRARPVPGSAMQVSERWPAMERIDIALLDAAWRLGAWDVERTEHRGCSEVASAPSEALACRRAFGDYDDGGAAAPQHLVSEAPDRLDLMRLAAKVGYIRWLFRPVQGGIWSMTDDATLAADGSRQLPCPVEPLPAQRDVFARSARTVYRLGRADRLIVVGPS